MKHLLLALLITLVAGCASTKRDYVFDGSTAESTELGVSAVRKRLKPAEQLEFLMALIAIQFSDVTSIKDIAGDPTMTEEINYFIIDLMLLNLLPSLFSVDILILKRI